MSYLQAGHNKLREGRSLIGASSRKINTGATARTELAKYNLLGSGGFQLRRTKSVGGAEGDKLDDVLLLSNQAEEED